MTSTSIVYDIIARDNASKTLRNVEQSSSRVARTMGKLGKVAAVGVAALGGVAVKVAVDSIKAASDAEQSLGGTQAVFGKYADQVVKQSNRAAGAYGLSANQYRESANLIGSLLKNQGVGMDKLAGKTQKMVGLASDLAATYGGTTKDAVEALSSAFKGEFDPLEQYGISLKQSTVNAEALRVAHVKSTSAFNKLSAARQAAAKRAATENVLMKQSKDAQGQFAKQSHSLAEQQQVLSARFENVKAMIGAKLLPIISKLTGWLANTGIPAFQRFAAAIGPPIRKGIAMVVKVVRQLLPPIISIVRSVVSIVKSLWHRFGKTLVAYTKGTLGNAVQVIRGTFKIIAGIFKLFADLLHGNWKGVWRDIKQILSGALTVVKALIRQALNLIKTLWKLGWSALTGILGGIWKGVTSLVRSGADRLVGLIRGIPGKLRNLAGVFGDAGRWLIHAFVDGMKNAAGIIGGIAGNVWSAVKSLLNGAIDRINSALEFKISLPGPDIHVNLPDIPHLAKGGIVRRPTLALIGERGPEAVVPLGRRTGGGIDYDRLATAIVAALGPKPRQVPLVGQVIQQPGQSVDELAEALWFKTRTRG